MTLIVILQMFIMRFELCSLILQNQVVTG